MIGFMVRAVSRFSSMNIRTFNTRQAAMEWLASEVTKTWPSGQPCPALR